MNTNDEVKFVYLQSGQTPATPDAGTVYFNPTTKDISVGDVAFQTLPSASTSDNGKVLSVVDGAWGAMDVPNGLPAVTGADDGSILQVVNGAWAKASQSKGIMIFMCTSASTPTLADGKTMADLNTAYDNGYLVIVKKVDTEFIMIHKIGSGTPIFISGYYQNGVARVQYLVGSSTPTDNRLTLYSNLAVVIPQRNGTILKSNGSRWLEADPELPAVSASDNGNVLAVVNGAWAKSAPESPIAVYDICFDDFAYDPDYGYDKGDAYWGKTKVAANKIISGSTTFCSELDANLAAGKPIMINAWVGDKCVSCLTSRLYNNEANRYNMENMTGIGFKSDTPYFADKNGYYITFHYTKNATSGTDGSFIGEKRAAL